MYYVLIDTLENSEEDAVLEGKCDFLMEFPFNFNEGDAKSHRLPDKEIVIEMFESSSRGKMNDNLIVDKFTGLFFSEKFKILYEKSGDRNNIEFIQIKILDEFSNIDEVILADMRGEELEFKSITYDNYHIANVVDLIDCIDHQASDLEYFVPQPGITDDMPEEMKKALQEEEVDLDIDFIRKLVLDESKIPEDIMIFRLKDCPRILVFKEKIVNAIREEKLTGFVFTPLSEYTDEIPDDYEDGEADNEEKATEKVEQSAQEPERQEVETKIEEAPRPKKSIIIKKIKKN